MANYRMRSYNVEIEVIYTKDKIITRNMNQKTIAIIYDFDKTLTPRPMREYISWPQLSNDEKMLMWDDHHVVHSNEDEDKELFWMRKIKQYSDLRPGQLTKQFFWEQGKRVTFFDGVETHFTRVNSYVNDISFGTMKCHHYIISSSIKEVIEGTSIAHFFKNIIASQFHFETSGPTFPQIVVNDAIKTQCLYRINKGKEHWSDDVNEYMAEEERPVPFTNMVYIGDGLTDIPALSVVRKNGGYGLGVYSDTNEESLGTLHELIEGNRIDIAAWADYTEDSVLSRGLRTILGIIIEKVRLRQLKQESIAKIGFRV